MLISEQMLLELRIELEELITEREGMIAENLEREAIKSAPAFSKSSFDIIARQLQLLREKLITIAEPT